MTTTTLTATDILIAVSEGMFDGRESDLYDALKERRRQLDQRKKFDISVGDTVRFNDHANPAYLRGQLATVTAKLQKNLKIKLVEPQGRFSDSSDIRCPIGIVDKVEEA